VHALLALPPGPVLSAANVMLALPVYAIADKNQKGLDHMGQVLPIT
jgi:hypothetical protein